MSDLTSRCESQLIDAVETAQRDGMRLWEFIEHVQEQWLAAREEELIREREWKLNKP